MIDNSTNTRNSSMMFTDIVGYSSMVGKDEKNALKLLAEHDSLIEPIINANNGKIIKKIGDAIFAEFPDSDKSTNASINIQITLHKRNELNRKNNLIHMACDEFNDYQKIMLLK